LVVRLADLARGVGFAAVGRAIALAIAEALAASLITFVFGRARGCCHLFSGRCSGRGVAVRERVQPSARVLDAIARLAVGVHAEPLAPTGAAMSGRGVDLQVEPV